MKFTRTLRLFVGLVGLVGIVWLGGCVRSPAPREAIPAESKKPSTPQTVREEAAPTQVEDKAVARGETPTEPTPTESTPTPAPPPPEAEEHAKELIEKALALQKQGKHDEALAHLKEATPLAAGPATQSEVLFRKGINTFFKAQKDAKKDGLGPEATTLYQEALKIFNEMLKLYPQEKYAPNASSMKGSCYLQMEDPAKALVVYQGTFINYPDAEDRARTLLRVGVCQASVGLMVDARASLRSVIRLFPDQEKVVKKAQSYLTDLNMVGRKAPLLRATEWLNGGVGPEDIRIFDGEVVVLVFFATWCSNCSKLLPKLRELIDRWSEEGAVFIGVANPDDPQNELPVDVYVKKHQIPYLDVALDHRSRARRAYHAPNLPRAVIIGRDGIVRWKGHLAFLPRPIMEQALGEQ